MAFSDAPSDFEYEYVHVKSGRALICGSHVYAGRADRKARYRESLGVDMIEGLGVDLVHDLEKPLPPEVGKFDHVDCMSVLEHARHPWLIAENIVDVMVHGGTIFLTVPFIWRPHAYPNDFWRFTAECVSEVLFPGIVWNPIMYATDVLRSPAKARWGRSKDDSLVQRQFPMLPRSEVFGFGVKP